MVKIWELTQGERRRRRARSYDLVVLDAPATGHALGMLRSPSTFGAIARVGPIAGQSERLRELLEDPARSAYLAVAHANGDGRHRDARAAGRSARHLGRDLEAVVVNGVLPQRFTAAELERIAQLNGSGVAAGAARAPRAGRRRGQSASDAVVRSAALAAHAVHDRARFQHNQVARLRRRRFEVLGVPFVFADELDLPAIRRIGEQLGRQALRRALGYAQAVEQPLVGPPVAADAHGQVEVDLTAELALEPRAARQSRSP